MLVSTTAEKSQSAGGTRPPEPSKATPESKKGAGQNQLEQGHATSRRLKKAERHPSGVGGWLFLLVLGMILLWPTAGAVAIASTIRLTEEMFPNIVSNNQWSEYKVLTWLAFILFSLLSIYGGFSLINGGDQRIVRGVKLIIWINGPVAAVTFLIIIPVIVFGKTDVLDGQFIRSLVGSTIFAVIWTSYLNRSKRVRNTYGSGA